MNPQLLAAISAALIFTSAFSFAQQPPAQRYDLSIPEPEIVTNSGVSRLIATFGDAAGNTLYIISHTQVIAGPGFSVDTELAHQWVMVSGLGTILAARTFPRGSDFPTDIISFSRRRILARVGSGNSVFIEAFRPQAGELVSEGLALELALETEIGEVARESQQRPPQRFFDVVISNSGKVTNIRRFDTTKVKPVPR